MAQLFSFILTGVSLIASLATLILLLRSTKRRERILAVVLCIFILLASWGYWEIRSDRDVRRQAQALIAKWEKPGGLKFRSAGERIGIISAGLSFLELHKSRFPDTYRRAEELVRVRAKGFKGPPERSLEALLDDLRRLEDVAAAIIGLVEGIAAQ